MGWAIALHGGAGVPHSLPPERRLPREAGLRNCLAVGIAALKDNNHALDVVELVVLYIIIHCISALLITPYLLWVYAKYIVGANGDSKTTKLMAWDIN